MTCFSTSASGGEIPRQEGEIASLHSCTSRSENDNTTMSKLLSSGIPKSVVANDDDMHGRGDASSFATVVADETAACSGQSA